MTSAARQHIVDATSDLLERQGYHATGLSQIVKESGAPRGSLYYYFPEGKEQMAVAAIRQKAAAMVAHAEASLAAHADPVAAVVAFIDHVASHCAVDGFCRGAPMAAVALETAASSARLRAACAAAYTELQRPFTNKLIDGGFPAERSQALALFIIASLEGGVVLARTQKSATPLRNVADAVRVTLECARAQQ